MVDNVKGNIVGEEKVVDGLLERRMRASQRCLDIIVKVSWANKSLGDQNDEELCRLTKRKDTATWFKLRTCM